MPSLEDLRSKAIISGTPAANDLLPYFDVDEFGNNPVKKTTVSNLFENVTIVSADISDASNGTPTIAPNKAVLYNALGGIGAWDRITVRGVEVEGSEVTLTPFIISFTDGDNDSISFEAPVTFGASFVYNMPLVSGTMAVLPEYVDATAANAVVSIGDAWWDTTLKKARVRLS